MSIGDDVKVPANAQALIVAPNIVSARFIQLTPPYKNGAALADGASIELKNTGGPVEWDAVKREVTELSTELAPHGDVQGPLAAVMNQAAETFDGNGDSF